MIRDVASTARPANSAPMAVGWGRREPPIHGRQDKSADRGRAHVVGGIDVFGDLLRPGAGARATKTSDINGPSAITRINAEGRRP
jgi:hypothetical protein